MALTELNILKARTGVYEDNAENRRLGRVGQRYGMEARELDVPESKIGESKKETQAWVSALINNPDRLMEKLNRPMVVAGELSNEELKHLISEYDTLYGVLARGVNAKKTLMASIGSYKHRQLTELAGKRLGAYRRVYSEQNNGKKEAMNYALVSLQNKIKSLEAGGFASFALGRIKEKDMGEPVPFKGNILETSVKGMSREVAAGYAMAVEKKMEELYEANKDKWVVPEEPKFTGRPSIEEIPSAGTVNFDKYLSPKIKREAEQPIANVIKKGDKMIADVVKNLRIMMNENVDADGNPTERPKSLKAKLLYCYMKLKREHDIREIKKDIENTMQPYWDKIANLNWEFDSGPYAHGISGVTYWGD